MRENSCLLSLLADKLPSEMLLAVELPWQNLSRLDVRAAVDILLIAIIIYYTMVLLRGTRAAQMMVAIILLVVFFYAARWARLEMVEWLLTTLLPYAAIALIVLFQPEIRRALSGHNPLWRRFYAPDLTESHDDVLLAAHHCSQNKIGALIVFEREVGLKTYVESGVPLDAALSYDLLVSIFLPGSPLHDGAVIIQGNRVAAAACFLPLSLNPTMTKQLGTRHRAAIGVTEESDAITVVVSEQTGEIALATAGSIELHLTPEQLAERLAALFAGYRPRVVLPARTQAVRE